MAIFTPFQTCWRIFPYFWNDLSSYASSSLKELSKDFNIILNVCFSSYFHSCINNQSQFLDGAKVKTLRRPFKGFHTIRMKTKKNLDCVCRDVILCRTKKWNKYKIVLSVYFIMPVTVIQCLSSKRHVKHFCNFVVELELFFVVVFGLFASSLYLENAVLFIFGTENSNQNWCPTKMDGVFDVYQL